MNNSTAELLCTDCNEHPALTQSAPSLASILEEFSNLDRCISIGDVLSIQAAENQTCNAGSEVSFEMGPISGEGPSRHHLPVALAESKTFPNHLAVVDGPATVDGPSNRSDFYAEHFCERCNAHEALTKSTVSLASIPTGCFFRRYCIDALKDADIPKNYWGFSPRQMTYAKLGDGSKGIISVIGPIQSGKTALLCAAMIRCIVINSVSHLTRGGPERSHLFVEGPREFRNLARFYPENGDAELMYDVSVLAIDDVDKVDQRHFDLVRDVVVHREQNGFQTLLSMTNVQLLREFAAQVYRRIENATILTLQNNVLKI